MVREELKQSGWNIVRLGEICTIYDGTHQTPKYVEHGIPFYSVENVTNNEFTYTKFITPEEHELISKRAKVEKGDVLMTRIGSIGKCKYIDWDVNASIYVSLALLKCSPKISPLFLSFSSESEFFKKDIKENSLQWAVPQKINLGKIADVRLLMPPLEEQKAIATALSDVDELIANLEKLIEKKKAIKQGTMQALLTGEKRLPGFIKPWQTEIFGELCVICRGGSPRPIQAYLTTHNDGINWIKIGDVKQNAKYITSTKEKIIEAGASKSRRVYKGDFILSNSMSFGRPYILKVDGCIHDGWLAIQEYQKSFDINFLYYLLGADYVFEQYIQMAAGSSVQNLNKEKVAQLIMHIPSIEEQKAIASILSDMDSEVDKLEEKLDKYCLVKQGMMQKLLTGEIRLV